MEHRDNEPRQYRCRIRKYKLGHIAPELLEHIIRQVEIEDYHVGYISSFAWEGAAPEDVMMAINYWAKREGLKVSINQELGICFFEKL